MKGSIFMEKKQILRGFMGFVLGTLIAMSPLTGMAIPVKAAEVDGSNDVHQLGNVKECTATQNKVNLSFSTGEKMRITFLKNSVFRLDMEPGGVFPENPQPRNPSHTTTIVSKTEKEYEGEYLVQPTITQQTDKYVISTDAVELNIGKTIPIMQLYDKKNNKLMWKEKEPIKYDSKGTTQTLETDKNEYFYGGGQQNGYFSHKNKIIQIANENNWNDGGVSSPNPFYMSTEGYGVLRNTFQAGTYDFHKTATFMHNEQRFDAFYFVEGNNPGVLEDYVELTGNPALMPKFGFYQGNANGYKNTLMTVGLQVAEDYKKNDMPVGWFLPNDGYGCGYGSIDNLKNFTTKIKDFGFETGLWTQSNLDQIASEVSIAGTRAVKTDVAWVGSGYSFGLNAVRQAAEGISKNADARPFVISLDGWAGTQRYAGIWSGDQTGGNWEYIRMHIPTYIGAGLSGMPYVGSDLDGIFGGKNVISTRDFQWKSFTPIMINMAGWSEKIKNPWVWGEPYTSINRMYLDLKAQMLPYYYSIAAEASKTGMPMVRALMLEYPNDSYTYGTQTQYEYMWGNNMLVAPVYCEEDNNAGVRNNIYLPDKNQVWIDYFTGDQYKGGVTVNNIKAPLWKLPLFIKNGAIIPMTVKNNSVMELDGSEDRIFDVYPCGETSFKVYDDDGKTEDYKKNEYSSTTISSSAPENGDGTAVITVAPSVGNFEGMKTERATQFIVNVAKEPAAPTVKVGNNAVTLAKVNSQDEFNSAKGNVYFYNQAPNMNPKNGGDEFNRIDMKTKPKLYVKVSSTDVTKNKVELTVKNFNNTQEKGSTETEVPETPKDLAVNAENTTDSQITLTWAPSQHAAYYEVKIGGEKEHVISNILNPSYIHQGLESDTEYQYQVRAVNSKGASEWTDVLTAKTTLDRFRNVPKNMTTSWDYGVYNNEIAMHAVDGNEGTLFHSAGNAIDKAFIIDMQMVYQLEKFEYMPRPDKGNGTIKQMELYASDDGKNYIKVASVNSSNAWNWSGESGKNTVRTIKFAQPINARYLKVVPKVAVGNFMSAHEFRPYKVEGTGEIIIGDYSNNGVIDNDDLTFLQNYTGIKSSDATWGYASKADLNSNGIIDAYDLAYVSSRIGSDFITNDVPISGLINIRPDKTNVKSGETVTIDLIGTGLADVNAFSGEIQFNTEKFEVLGATSGDIVKSVAGVSDAMINYSSVRGVGDKTARVYAIFANKGKNITINNKNIIAQIKLKAKVDTIADFEITNSAIVNTSFDTLYNNGVMLQPGEQSPTYVPIIPSKIKLSADKIRLDSADVENADITETGHGPDKLIDGKIEDENSFDLKYDGSITLPVGINLMFKDTPQNICKIVMYNRLDSDGNATGNGRPIKVNYYGHNTVDNKNTYDSLGSITFKNSDKQLIFQLPEKFKQKKYERLEIVFDTSSTNTHQLNVAELELYQESKNLDVSDIEFAATNVSTMTVGDKNDFHLKVKPDTAANRFVALTSSDSSLLKVIRTGSGVDADYKLQAVAPGKVTITASTAGGFSKSTQVTVLPSDIVEPTVTAVTVTPKTVSVKKGNTSQFTATVEGKGKFDTNVEWNVTGGTPETTISKTGLLTIAANETATSLTVTAKSTVDGSKSGTATVTVTSEQLPEPTDKTITAFDAPDSSKYVKNGTKIDSLNLPTILHAIIDGVKESIKNIIWVSNPDYNPTTAGTYTFTSEIKDSGYVLGSGVTMPKITVTVAKPSNGGDLHHKHSSSGNTNPIEVTPSTTTTTTTPAGGTVTAVTTQLDTVPVVTGNKSAVTVTIPADVASIISAATVQKQAEVKIAVPVEAIMEQLNNNAVKTIDLTIHVPSAVANNTNTNVKLSINTPQAILQAAKDLQKDITIKVTDSQTGKEAYSWTFSGIGLKNSVTSVSDVNLAMNAVPVKTDMVANAIVANNTVDKKASGVVLKFSNSRLLPSPAAVKVYVGNHEGCTPNSKVYLYYLNSTTKTLEQMPQNQYTVDANGFVTITISCCSEYVLLPQAATNPYPVKSDTSFPTGVKNSKSYTFAMTVSGNKVPKFTVGNGKAFTGTVKQQGNKYYFTVNAIGTAGTMTAVYSTLPGQKPVVMSYIAVIK